MKGRAEFALEAATLLAKLLDDPIEPVRDSALQALVAIGPRAIPSAVSVLTNGGPEGRDKAVAVIVQLLAKDNEKKDALNELKPFQTQIASLLDDKAAPIVGAGITLLGLMGQDAEFAKPQILKKIRDPQFATIAAIVVGSFGEGAVQSLLDILKDKDANLRASAAFALGQVGVDGRLALMESITMRRSAPSISAMDKFRFGNNAKSAVPSLITALDDESIKVRLMATVSLGRMKGDAIAAIPALGKAAETNDENLKSLAEEAIVRIKETPKNVK